MHVSHATKRDNTIAALMALIIEITDIAAKHYGVKV